MLNTMSDMIANEPAIDGRSFEAATTKIKDAIAWYNRHIDRKQAKVFVINYMIHTKRPQQDIEKMNLIRSNRTTIAMGSIARLVVCNCPIPETYTKSLDEKISTLIGMSRSPKTQHSKGEFGDLVIAAVETLVDQFYLSDYSKPSSDVYSYLSQSGASKSDASRVKQYYTPLLEEVSTFDEGYGRLGKRKRKNYITFLQSIIDDCNQFVKNNKISRKSRKPRKVKAKSADQISSKAKFKARDDDLKLVSVNPADVVGSQVAWLYNSKWKRLTLLAAPSGQTLSIKRTTIVDFDPKQSYAKRIRKPEVTVSALAAMGKVAAIKAFDAIKATKQPAKGRLSDETMIIRTAR